MAFWDSRSVWEQIEWFAKLGAVFTAVVVAIDKLAGAGWGTVAGLILFVAGGQLKRIDAKTATDKAALLRRVAGVVLAEMRKEYFTKVEDHEMHLHRITLFRCADPTPKTPRRLEIFARSGRFGGSTRTWVVDDDDEGKCEGIAGLIWFRDAALTTELPACPDPSDAAAVAAYAAAGRVTAAQVPGLNVRSRAFSGAVVRRHGQKWGILIVDSVNPGIVTKTREHRIKWYAELIGAMIAEGET